MCKYITWLCSLTDVNFQTYVDIVCSSENKIKHTTDTSARFLTSRWLMMKQPILGYSEHDVSNVPNMNFSFISEQRYSPVYNIIDIADPQITSQNIKTKKNEEIEKTPDACEGCYVAHQPESSYFFVTRRQVVFVLNIQSIDFIGREAQSNQK